MSQLAFFQGAEIGLLEAPLYPGTPVDWPSGSWYCWGPPSRP